MKGIFILLFLNIFIANFTIGQSIVYDYQLGTLGNDYLGNLKYNNFWDALATAQVNGTININSAPLNWDGCIIVYFDSTVNFITFGDSFPEYKLNSVIH